MCLDKKLQCKSTYEANQIWNAKRIVNQLTPEQKQQLLEKIQAETILNGKEVKNKEIYNLLKGDANDLS